MLISRNYISLCTYQYVLKRLLLWLFFIMFSPALFAEQTLTTDALVDFHSTSDLAEIKKRKTLKALVTYNRTNFTILPNGKPKGLQVELLQAYEKHLNKGVNREVDKTRIVFIPTTFDRIMTDLKEGKGDIAAALLTVTPERQKQVRFVTAGLKSVNEVVVVHHSITNINKIEDLSGQEVYVLRNSSYAEHLNEINQRFISEGLAPIIVRQANSYLLTEDIIEMVNAGIVRITIVDDFEAKLWATALGNIRVLDKVAIKESTSIGWAIRKDNPELYLSLASYLNTVKKGTLLGNILFKRYFSSSKWITNPLAENEHSRFRRVLSIFEKYSHQYDFDVLAAMAQAYQESKLDNNRVSHRGAIGIMQLLPSTAADPNVNIPDISDLENNIHAGVKYMAFIRDRYFSDPEISPVDRLAFSWAAYNAGPSSVAKMRKKAKRLGLNPNVWFGNVEIAAARLVGNETVKYVRNTLKYYVAYTLISENIKTKNEILKQEG